MFFLFPFVTLLSFFANYFLDLIRFGKDMEGLDAALPDHLGRSIMYGLGVLTTLTVVASVSPIFLLGFAFLTLFYVHYAK